jgi:biopolymer transport protein ExbB
LLLGFQILPVAAQETQPPAAPAPAKPLSIDFVQLFRDGGTIGYLICGLSLAMVALIFEHLLTIRRGTMIPRGLPEEAHRLISTGQYKAAEELCKSRPSLLGYMLASALPEIGLGYPAVEKAMEDAAAEQSARLLRKIEYLSMIGTVAPMLGLMGTVWGMILAFMEFERKANPQISELAPGVYKALVTTLFGLIVAIPALSAFAYFRNRIDELVAQTSLMAEHIFADYKRTKAGPKPQDGGSPRPRPEAAGLRPRGPDGA